MKMSLTIIKIFWIGLLVVLSICMVFLGTVGIPVTQTTVTKNIPKDQWTLQGDPLKPL